MRPAWRQLEVEQLERTSKNFPQPASRFSSELKIPIFSSRKRLCSPCWPSKYQLNHTSFTSVIIPRHPHICTDAFLLPFPRKLFLLLVLAHLLVPVSHPSFHSLTSPDYWGIVATTSAASCSGNVAVLEK